MSVREETRVDIHEALRAIGHHRLMADVIQETETPMIFSAIYGSMFADCRMAFMEATDAQP